MTENLSDELGLGYEFFQPIVTVLSDTLFDYFVIIYDIFKVALL